MVVLGILVLGSGSVIFSQAGTCSVEVKQYASVPYISGGVGLDERQGLEQMGKDYNLKLVFAAIEGKYMGDVNVTVTDTTGQTLLEAISDGPWFYTNLPPGKYNISVQSSGQTFNRTVTLSQKKQTTAHFSWK